MGCRPETVALVLLPDREACRTPALSKMRNPSTGSAGVVQEKEAALAETEATAKEPGPAVGGVEKEIAFEGLLWTFPLTETRYQPE